MRVMITGATGFIGYHTALALLEAGHEVSLLVRSAEKMEGLFGPGRIRHYTCGDITDRDSVRRAMAGCDAVVHVAALVSTHARDAEKVRRTNTLGVKHVIGGAAEAGLARIVHVSSVTALYNPKVRVLDETSLTGTAASGYGRSKVECEEYVRGLQAAGAPVFITYPATVLGPETPALTEAHIGLRTYLANFVPVMSSGNQYIDVRDLAVAHRRILELRELPGAEGPHRYTLGGHYIPWVELGPLLERLTGRPPRQVPLNPRLLRVAGGVLDRLERFLPLDVPVTAEGVGYATRWVPMDNSWAEQRLGLTLRPVEETLADTIRWLCAKGHITAKQAGLLAG